MKKEDLTKLEPHTPEWFEAMGGISMLQAAHAASLIIKTGKKEICTVCGDTPAPVGVVEPGHRISLRLCKYCQGHRKNTYDETFRVLRD